MKKRNITLILLACLVLTLLSCQKKQIAPQKPSHPEVSVSFCIDILGTEEPIFTKPVLSTLLAIEKKGTIKLVKEHSADKSEYGKKLSLCAERSNLIICGPLMAEEVITISELYPDKFFLLLDYPGKGKNIISVTFQEDELAKRAMIICENNSKTKKWGALFLGDPESPLSLVLKNILKPARVDFLPFGTKSVTVLEKLKAFEKGGIDFVFLDRAPYLEEVIGTLSKNNKPPFQIICPRIILPDNSSLVFATIEKNYEPVLSKIVQDFITQKLVSKSITISDFGSVLTR